MRSVVVDTSAAVALLTGEPEGAKVAHSLRDDDTVLMSAASMVELEIVLTARFGPIGATLVNRFLRTAEVTVVPVSQDQADLAVDAYARYGKGLNRPGLNYGDTFVYALASSMAAEILALGDEFSMTDLSVLELA